MRLGAAWRLLRPKQWAKNLLVLAALIFAHRFDDPDSLVKSALAFAALCLISSAIYCFNDAKDVEKDRLHPRKKKRPMASGEVPVPVGIGIGVACLLGGLAVSAFLSLAFLYGIGAYLGLQLAYNLILKNRPLLDVFSLALGMVMRAALGAVAIQAMISGWLLFCTGALALLLGFAKRRNEFLLEDHDAAATRPALAGYTQGLLDTMVVFAAALAGLSYGVYAIESATAKAYPALILTTPFVLYAIARYLLIIFVRGDGGEPENDLFGDRHLVLAVIIFLGLAVFAMTKTPLPFIGDAPPDTLPK